MKKIVILSGKGGVGKSSITASLAVVFSEKYNTVAVDCDVDASNLALVLGTKEEDFTSWEHISTNLKAEIDYTRCNSCKKCYEACYFDAIGWKGNKPLIKDFGCEGCGVCEIICPEKAISLKQVKNAKVGHAKTRYNINLFTGQLDIGESGSGKVVSEVRKLAEKNSKSSEIMLIDAAAGIGCPVIASVVNSDFAVAVTEPTPAAFSDLKRALKVVEHFKVPCGIIINKHDINPKITKKIEDFAASNNIPLLAKIKYDKTFIDALVNMQPLVVYEKEYYKLFNSLSEKLSKKINFC